MADIDAGDLGDLSDAYGILRERRARSEIRWNRLAVFGLYIAAIFGAATLHGIWTGDDLAGLVMTIVPGLAMLGFWAYARLRVSQITEGRRPGIVQRVVSWGLVAAAIAVVAFAPRRESQRDERAMEPRFITIPPGAFDRDYGQRKEDCPDRWFESPHPYNPDRKVIYCAANRIR